ncbi:hypothetical protein HBI56_164950 [Parastagonospora nodorum]|nr:hypothetical protein HBH52_067290 [Parastagonospora nodorum]KAH4210322.1 hypothetical protein HBI95_074060 [Parastagonospora nodorum]KAH4361383.1 hypothetical protein HBH97_199280 [Parastagonospora nodorum]KAH4412045.1 hypothetical protein HBH92_106590 [Parastagonospora nodorum]KAH4435608.1 hypothetical protein HBH93_118970 [Parastagonospora nodorum]
MAHLNEVDRLISDLLKPAFGMRHHRHRPTILSDCLIVISIKGSFSNFVGVNDRMQLVPGTAALWLRRTFYGIGE